MMDKKSLCRIRDTYRAIGQIDMQMRQLFGLNLNEAMMLCALQEGDMNSGHLAQTLGITPSSASKIIKRLENLGFVVRRLAYDDRRSMVVSLTEQGQNKLKSIACDKINIPSPLSEDGCLFFSSES